MARKSRKSLDTTAISITADTKTLLRQIFAVGAYIRLSVFDRKGKGDSIETQQAIIKAFIDEHPDLELVDIYIDNGRSGQSFERPAFIQMIADMESGKVNCCITKDLSRLGRNAIDTGYYIEKYFPTHGIRYIAISDDYDSAKDNNSIMVSLKNMVNEVYALEAGRETRAAKQLSINSGKYIGRLAPYGYLKSKADKHILVPDETTSPIVKKIFEMAGEGIAVSAIKKWLHDCEILPPLLYFHSIGLASDKEAPTQKHWNIATIYSILDNRVYCGDVVQGKFRVSDGNLVKQPKSDWVVVEDMHEALVTRELFDKVRELRAESRIGHAAPKAFSENIFVGKVLCGHCGYSLKRTRYDNNNYVYKCRTSALYSNDDCKPFTIKENDLKELLICILNEQATIFSDITTTSQITNEGGIKKNELAKLQSEISKNSNFLKGLYESLMEGDITNSEYKELKAGYESKIAELSEKEAQLRKYLIDDAVKSVGISKATTQLQRVQRISDLSAETIQMLVDKILVYRDKHIEVHLKFADEMCVSTKTKDETKEIATSIKEGVAV